MTMQFSSAATLTDAMLSSDDLKIIAKRFRDKIEEHADNKEGVRAVSLPGWVQTFTAEILREKREAAEISKRIADYKSTFALDSLTMRDYLAICNNGSIPTNPDSKRIAEEKYKRFVLPLFASARSARAKRAAATKAGKVQETDVTEEATDATLDSQED